MGALYGEPMVAPKAAPVRLDGRVAVVTGSGRGLGREHALLIAAHGARVVVNDVHPDHARATADDIVRAGGEAVADTNTVATPGGAADLVAHAVDRFGGLHLLVNNAGRGGPAGLFTDTPLDLVDTIVSTHLLGTYYVCHAAWPHLTRQGYGRIVNTASNAAIGNSGMAAYGMAKAGVLGLTRSLAVEGAPHGVRVNAVLPIGYTRSAALNPNEDTRRWMEENFPAALCSPAVVALLAEDVPCSGDFFATGAGRTALLGTVTTPGWNGGPSAGVDDLRANWDRVTDPAGLAWMRHSRDDIGFYTGEAAFNPAT